MSRWALLLTPMPRASDRTATRVKPGLLLTSSRAPKRRSCRACPCSLHCRRRSPLDAPNHAWAEDPSIGMVASRSLPIAQAPARNDVRDCCTRPGFTLFVRKHTGLILIAKWVSTAAPTPWQPGRQARRRRRLRLVLPRVSAGHAEGCPLGFGPGEQNYAQARLRPLCRFGPLITGKDATRGRPHWMPFGFSCPRSSPRKRPAGRPTTASSVGAWVRGTRDASCGGAPMSATLLPRAPACLWREEGVAVIGDQAAVSDVTAKEPLHPYKFRRSLISRGGRST